MGIFQIIRYRIQRNSQIPQLPAVLHKPSIQVRSTAQPLPDRLLIFTSPLMCGCCSKYFTEIELEKTIKKAWMPFQLLWIPRQKSPSLSKLQNRRHRKYLQGFSLPAQQQININDVLLNFPCSLLLHRTYLSSNLACRCLRVLLCLLNQRLAAQTWVELIPGCHTVTVFIYLVL